MQAAGEEESTSEVDFVSKDVTPVEAVAAAGRTSHRLRNLGGGGCTSEAGRIQGLGTLARLYLVGSSPGEVDGTLTTRPCRGGLNRRRAAGIYFDTATRTPVSTQGKNRNLDVLV